MPEKWGGRVLWYSIGVAVLLVACILYSGALAAPYNTNGPSYVIAHESTEAFENYVEDSEELQEISAVPVADLSLETQRAFDEMQSPKVSCNMKPRLKGNQLGNIIPLLELNN